MVDSESQLEESQQKFTFAVWDIMDYLFEVIGIDDPNQKYLKMFARRDRKGWTSWGNEL